MSDTSLIVIAKQPVAGRVKTRLCPPCTPAQAATLAEAALADTFAALSATPARRRVVALDGDLNGLLPPGFEVVPQPSGGLGQRLASAFEAVGGPALLVGMDTPQLSRELLIGAIDRLSADGTDAVLGPSVDGGYWAIGLRRPDPGVFRDVPMSTTLTGRHQAERLSSLGLCWSELPVLRDVDTIADARAVVDAHPETRFARTLSTMGIPSG